MTRLNVSSLILLVALLVGVAGAATWTPINGIQAQEEAPLIDLLRNDAASIQLNLSISGFYREAVATTAGNFSRLSFDGEGYTTEIGRPELPVIRKLIEIPYGAQAELIIGPMTARRGTLAEFGITGPIMPVQPSVRKIPGAKEAAQFVMDQAAYAQDGYSIAEFARLGDEGYLRGHHFVLLEIYPLDYSPAQGTLLIVSDLEITIRLTGSDIDLTQAMKARYADPRTNALAQRLFINHLSGGELDLIPPPIGLLIITSPHNAGLPILQEFVQWKEDKGFHTTVATTQQTGTTTAQIKAYIQNAYDTWPIPPNFVLLIGDTDVIPYWPATGPGTDLYYATLEGADYFNDVGIGRLSPSNDTNLANMINKTLDYEQVGWTGGDEWEKAAVFMASNDNYTVSEGTHNFVISTYLDPDGYRSTKLYCHTYGATTQQVTDNINAGRSLAIYSGHGSETSWADGPPFGQSNVQALVNTVYPLVTSHACLTGQYMYGECFGETWLRTPHGTMVFWGSVDYTYWGEDDILERGMFEGFFNEQSPQQDQNLTWVAGMTDYAKYYLWQNYGGGGMSQSYWEQYNILGDPTVDIWTDVPQNLTVNFPPAILIGQNSLQVNVSGYPDWAMVNVLSDAEDLQFTGYVNSGVINFNLGTGFTVPGTMNVWVTGHDCHPYHGTAQIIPPSGPYVIFDSLVVNDSPMGNGNGQLDYAETSELTIYAKNVGVAPANNVTLNITTQDSLLTILDGSEFLGTLAPGAIAHTNRGFTVHASSQLPDMHALACQLTAVSGSSNWTSSFSILGHAPVVEFDSLVVHDDSGNQNGCLDPGEIADLEIFLKNNGSSSVPDMQVTASCADPYVTITANTTWVEPLIPGWSSSGTITVSVSSACPQEHEVTFSLDIHEFMYGYATTSQFSTVIGNILYAPTGPDAYGYSAYDPYDAPETPDYNWIEISADSAGPGTLINFTQDDQYFVFPLPFSFRYYGAQFDTFSVGANGWISIGRADADDYSNSAIPNSDGPPNMIAAYWEDLSPQRTNSGKVWRWFDAVNHRLVIEYNHVEQYTPVGAFETFQVILLDEDYYPTATNDGRILCQYKSLSTNFQGEGTVGIENAAETIGLQYLFDGSYDVHAHPISDGTAILYSTPTSLPSVTINLTPLAPPILIPVQGGSFNFNATLHNEGGSTASFAVWIMVQLPNMSWYGPVLGPINLTLSAGSGLVRLRTQSVPASAPAGNYTYEGRVGTYPSTIWDSDSFGFEKAGAGISGLGAGDWTNTGESFENWMAASAVELPTAFALEQNYPNPFNPATAISYQLSANRLVNLRIYDTAGRLVATLVNGWREAGSHQVTWDASGLPSGLYFCRMQAGSWQATSKMVLMK